MGDNSELRRIMAAAGCTYRMMRAATGLSSRTIAKALRNPWAVRCQTLCRMAEHLGVGMADLLPISRPEKPVKNRSKSGRATAFATDSAAGDNDRINAHDLAKSGQTRPK